MFQGTTTKLSSNTINLAGATNATIRPKTDILKIVGGGSIQTIVPAFGGFNGFVILMAFGGAITLVSGGNIVMTTPNIVLPQDRAIFLVYVKEGAAWITSFTGA